MLFGLRVTSMEKCLDQRGLIRRNVAEKWAKFEAFGSFWHGEYVLTRLSAGVCTHSHLGTMHRTINSQMLVIILISTLLVQLGVVYKTTQLYPISYMYHGKCMLHPTHHSDSHLSSEEAFAL